MRYKKIIFPDQEDWEVQYDVIAYCDDTVGSLVYSTKYGWQSVLNGVVEDLYDANTEEEAKSEFKERLENFLSGEVEYFEELLSMIDEL